MTIANLWRAFYVDVCFQHLDGNINVRRSVAVTSFFDGTKLTRSKVVEELKMMTSDIEDVTTELLPDCIELQLAFRVRWINLRLWWEDHVHTQN